MEFQPQASYLVSEYCHVDIPMESLLIGGELDIDPAVSGKGFFDVQLKGRSLRLQAGGWVGRIPLNERVVLDIRPRISISNLARVLRIAGQAPRVLEAAPHLYELEGGRLPNIREIYAEALVKAMAPLAAHGLLREYTHKQRKTDVPRGRIMMGSLATQLASSGASTQVESSWFERSPDNLANRILKFALWSLSVGFAAEIKNAKGVKSLIRDLNRLFLMLDGVTLDRSLLFLVARSPGLERNFVLPPMRNYYSDPLRLAIALIRDLSVALDRIGDSVRVPPLVVGMDLVFENYLRKLLTSSEGRLSTVAVLDGNGSGSKLLFDELPSVRANPDIVLKRDDQGETQALAVGDVKYKPSNGNSKPSRVDLNQVISYGASYRSEIAIVIQPVGQQSNGGLVPLGHIGRLSVFQYLFDLGASDLKAEEDRFVDTIDGLVQPQNGRAAAV